MIFFLNKSKILLLLQLSNSQKLQSKFTQKQDVIVAEFRLNTKLPNLFILTTLNIMHLVEIKESLKRLSAIFLDRSLMDLKERYRPFLYS